MSKQITITRLELHNFKGATNLVVNFHPDRPTIISGRNGSGKTTIMDAFMWLLWGLNSDQQQTSKFGIKPNNADGTPRLDLDTEVEGTLTITDTETGETSELTAKRRWVSIWKTKSGEVEKEFGGNKGEYFINGVPVKESDYNATISNVIPPEIFKTITNPYHFPNLPWQKRREILLGMTDNVTYEDIAKERDEFEQFLRDLSGKTVADFNTELGAAINRITKEIDAIPGLITEAERAIPITPDYAALNQEKTDIEAELAGIDATLTSASEAARQQESRIAALYEQKRQLQDKQRAILDAAQQSAWERTRAANARREELTQQLNAKRHEWTVAKANTARQVEDFRTEKSRLEDEVKRLTEDQDELRKQWYRENQKQYTAGGQLVCPITKQFCADPNACYQHSQHEYESRQAFVESQRAELDRLTAQGQSLGQRITEAKARIADIDKRWAEAAAADGDLYEKTKAEGEALSKELEAIPEAIAPIIKGEDLPEWVALQKQVDELQAQINAPRQAADTAVQSARKRYLTDRLAEINRKLGLRVIIEQQQQRVRQLHDQELTLRQEKADLQKKQKVIEKMTKARMDELEKRINSRFKLVRFEMFEPTATTGEEKPNCVCWVGEAKYNDKNRAGKVHAGLDIINALCAYHRITAPVFIDNAEGVNEFIPTDSQLILLKVTTEDLKVE